MRLKRLKMATTLFEITLIIISSLAGGTAPIFIKKGTNMIHSFNIWKIIFNCGIVAGIFCYGMSYIISIPAFKYGDLTILYPLISLSYVWASLFSIKFLGEKMNKIKWSGIALIIAGVFFISLAI